MWLGRFFSLFGWYPFGWRRGAAIQVAYVDVTVQVPAASEISVALPAASEVTLSTSAASEIAVQVR